MIRQDLDLEPNLNLVESAIDTITITAGEGCQLMVLKYIVYMLKVRQRVQAVPGHDCDQGGGWQGSLCCQRRGGPDLP